MKRKTYFLAALALQVAVICWVAVPRLIVLHTGRSALLRTVPVDPRDPFRGDYVVLNYDVSNVPAGTAQAGGTVFAILEEGKDGFAKAAKFVTERPSGGELYLQGKVEERWGSLRAHYGIEAFFVPEGRGLVYERQRNHDVRVRISNRGFAVIDALVKRPGVNPDNESRGEEAAAAGHRPGLIGPGDPHQREPDGTSRKYVQLSGYQSHFDLLAVIGRHTPDRGFGARDTVGFYTGPPDGMRMLVHLPPVKEVPGRALTRARLLVAVPPGRQLDVWPMRRTFGVVTHPWGAQLEAPTWNAARYPKEPWTKPGVLGSPDVGEKLLTLDGSDDLQGIDITDAAKGAANAPFGLIFSWAPEAGTSGRGPHRAPHDSSTHVTLELTYAR